METLETKKMRKNASNYHCKICNFKCSKKSNWDQHCLTAKHKRKLLETDPTHIKIAIELTCECGKKYSSKSGLWKHKKVCKNAGAAEKNAENIITAEMETVEKAEEPDYKEMFFESMKVIKKQSEQLDRIIPVLGNNNITNNNNTTNNTFNLQFFLNETCKDALNITDFLNSLQVQLKDLEYTADNGHVKGITNIFHTALANIEENKRPMHCTDLKREVLYIKDNDEWRKDENKEALSAVVTKVVDKNIENQMEWMDNHPDVLVPGSKDSNKYIKMMSESLGEGTDTEQNKIMKNIMKDVTIDR
jgi:hypothetical protein